MLEQADPIILACEPAPPLQNFMNNVKPQTQVDTPCYCLAEAPKKKASFSLPCSRVEFLLGPAAAAV